MSLLDNTIWDARIAVDGWRAGAAGAANVTSPATSETLGRIGLASPTDVTAAADIASDRQRDWAARPYDERAAVLRRAGQLYEEHADEIAHWLTVEAGSTALKASVEPHRAAQDCYEAAALASAPYGDVLRTSQARMSMSRRLPVGTVGVISPFNFPLILSIRAVAPALALGNAVLLKPDVRTAVSGGVVLARVFEEAGLPAGLLSVLPGDVMVGEAVVTEPRVRVIAFTGSTSAGRRVATLAAQHLKRVHLELGGNNALIVFDDVDLDTAVSAAAWGSFFHQGQICMTSGRHIVQRNVAHDYAHKLAEHADRLQVGDPKDPAVALGPIIDVKQRDHVHKLVTGSVELGAGLLAGGAYEGLFYRPTVLDRVTTSMPAFAQEVFGPVAPVLAFDTIEQAIELARDTSYGLSLGILTRDVMKGVAIADAVPTGLVHINDQTVNDEATIPFGGVGDSGTGSRHGGTQVNLEAFTEAQWLTMRATPPRYPF